MKTKIILQISKHAQWIVNKKMFKKEEVSFMLSIYLYIYLRFELLMLLDKSVIIRVEWVIRRFEDIIVPFKLLCLPPCPAVLEPYSHLSWLQPQLLGQLGLSLWLQFVLCLKALLQQMHLNMFILIKLAKNTH